MNLEIKTMLGCVAAFTLLSWLSLAMGWVP